MGTYSVFKNGKLHVWEAERLWDLSRELPIKTVPLSNITNFDDVCWFHSSRAKPTCRAVATHAKRIYDADLSLPIVLSANGIMMDGMHRVAKAWLLGMEEIQAVQFLEDPQPDQILSIPEKKKRHNRISAGFPPALPTPPSMRVRTRRLRQGNENVPIGL